MISIGYRKEMPTYEDFESDFPKVIEGVEAYKTLCPVSSLTGHRDNPLSLLQAVANDPSKQRLLDSLLVEVSSKSADPRLSNDDLIGLMSDSLQSNSFFESDSMARKYQGVIEDFVASQRPSDDSTGSKKVVQNDVKTDDDILNEV